MDEALAALLLLLPVGGYTFSDGNVTVTLGALTGEGSTLRADTVTATVDGQPVEVPQPLFLTGCAVLAGEVDGVTIDPREQLELFVVMVIRGLAGV